ncbi:Basic leucine zipper 61, partial [Cucurbita argyrosperma subsp. sororia]
MEESFKMRMHQVGRTPTMATGLPPLPPLGKSVASSDKKLLLFHYHRNSNVYGNDKSMFSEGEGRTTLSVKQDQSQLPNSNNDLNTEAKRLKRVIQSRQYSQKYRLKQLHHITELESELKALQAEVTITSPRIKFMDRQNSLLRAENYSIKEKLTAYTGELLFKEAQYEELKRERNMLKEIYEVYQLKLLETLKGSNNNASIAAAAAGGGGSTFQVVENHPQSATKSNPFTMLQN